ncbi:hypothetical protein JCM14635_03240 [Megalodesulfovibrio paquesii]
MTQDPPKKRGIKRIISTPIAWMSGILTVVGFFVLILDPPRPLVELICPPYVCLNGTWRGVYEDQGRKVPMAVFFVEGGSSVNGTLRENRGTLEKPNIRTLTIPCERQDNWLNCDKEGKKFSGKILEKGAVIQGSWSSGGSAGAFKLQRAEGLQ